MVIILIIVGLLIGASLEGINGAALGALLGGLAGFIFQLRDQVFELKSKHNKLQDDFSRLSQHYEKHQFDINNTEKPDDTAPQEQTEEAKAPNPIVEESPLNEPGPVKPIATNVTPAVSTATPVPHFDNEINNTVQVSVKAPKTESKEKVIINETTPAEPKSNTIFDYAHNFVFTGNPIVKIASIVLFFGVAFLLKYAAEQNYFPIEWRFISVALVAIGLLIWGLKLTPTKRQYGLVIQGLSIGVLYLTTYAASSLYPLLPLNMAFFCLLILSVVSAILSVKQDAPSLAIIAVIGGFLAPILTSSGSNAYVKLFSYYAVLNLGILFISLFKSWRFLCWLGFAFTFVIGSLWGFKSYRPEFFESTEPFLIFHFLLYLIIPILFLRLKHLPVKPVVQTSVVFGLPTISFLLQLSMVQNFDNGYSYSALGWSLAYFLGALAIHFLPNKATNESKNLKISYIAIGITFFSLFIFFLFDQNITSVLWALEAVGLTWLGIRQKEFFPKFAGWILIVLSALLFLGQYHSHTAGDLFLNAQFLIGMIIAIAALTMGYFYSRVNPSSARQDYIEQGSSTILLIAATLLVFSLGIGELQRIEITNYLLPSSLLFTSIIASCYFVVGKTLKWKLLQLVSLVIIPALAVISVLHFLNDYSQNPISHLGFLAYPMGLAASYFIASKSYSQKLLPSNLFPMTMSIVYLSGIFIITWIIAHFSRNLSMDGDWFLLMFGLFPTITLFQSNKHYLSLAHNHSHKAVFPIVQIVLCAYLGFWFLITTFSTLHPDNLPYMPLLNPLDLTQAFLLYSLYKVNQQNPLMNSSFNFANFQYLIYGVVFVFINILVARSFHHYTGVPFKVTKLLSEPNFLLTLTIVWSLLATVVMYFARAKQSRSLWITGASLLVAILIKLVLFDMADSGTLTRIISFLVVGAIMLAIGYFVPMPPNSSKSDNSH